MPKTTSDGLWAFVSQICKLLFASIPEFHYIILHCHATLHLLDSFRTVPTSEAAAESRSQQRTVGMAQGPTRRGKLRPRIIV